MRPWYGGNTWAAMSSLKSMLPTASVSTGNARSETAPILIIPSWASDSSTTSALRSLRRRSGFDPAAGPAFARGESSALALK